jgi:hypothetical protein
LETYDTGATGAIKVTADSGKAGNAVVAVKVGGEIKWSWHIWVTGYDPEAEKTTSQASGLTFMSRNLGAMANDLSTAAYGLYYQWGRKDPFPKDNNSGGAQDAITIVAVGELTGTIPYSIQNPTVFIKTSSEPYDWFYGDIRQDDLWGHVSRTKSLYDPCPSGWRVPLNNNDGDSPWMGFTTDNSSWAISGGGRDWTASGLFDFQQYTAYPAAGCRVSTSGASTAGSSGGFYWSAVVDGTSGRHLYFNSTAVNPIGSSTRSYGFPVRCVQE